MSPVPAFQNPNFQIQNKQKQSLESASLSPSEFNPFSFFNYSPKSKSPLTCTLGSKSINLDGKELYLQIVTYRYGSDGCRLMIENYKLFLVGFMHGKEIKMTCSPDTADKTASTKQIQFINLIKGRSIKVGKRTVDVANSM
ncbi:hypothetical protein NC652_018785 [Populus alba x Populus x berolinensis]|nr:hypothetical protein NC652_018785 [Populus alba x Populus x berolinensis]